jgi:hypothetical protein
VRRIREVELLQLVRKTNSAVYTKMASKDIEIEKGLWTWYSKQKPQTSSRKTSGTSVTFI